MESINRGAVLSEKRLIDATFGDLEQWLDDYIKNAPIAKKTPENKVIRGLKNIADFLQISTRQVSRLKAQGILDHALRQSGNLIYAKETDLINCINTIKK